MNCPYCAEAIADEAIACKHCRRDFWLVAPLMKTVAAERERATGLERELEALRAAAEATVRSGERSALPPWAHMLLAGVTTTLVAGLAHGLSDLTAQSDPRLSGATALIFMLSPLVVGLWLGVGLVGFHSLGYLVTGAFTGLAVRALLHAFGSGTEHEAWWSYILWGTSVLVSGALIGDWVERAITRRAPERGLGHAVAKKLVRLSRKDSAPNADALIARLDRLVTSGSKALALVTGFYTLVKTMH